MRNRVSIHIPAELFVSVQEEVTKLTLAVGYSCVIESRGTTGGGFIRTNLMHVWYDGNKWERVKFAVQELLTALFREGYYSAIMVEQLYSDENGQSHIIEQIGPKDLITIR